MLKEFAEHMAVFVFLVGFFTLNLGWCFMCLKVIKHNIPKETILAFINSLRPPLKWYYFYFSGAESLKYVYTTVNHIRLYIGVSLAVITVGMLILVQDAQSENTQESLSATIWLIVSFVTLVGLRVWRFGKQLTDSPK